VHPPASLSPTRVVVAVAERLYVLDLAGTILSSVDVGDRIIAAPVVDREGHVHVLVQAGQIVVLDHGRHVRARIALDGRGFDQSAVLARDSDGSYRIAVPALGVIALERDGAQRWLVTTDAPFHGPLAIDASHTTLAFDRRGRLGVISVTGELRERVELGGMANGFPLLASDGTLWASTSESELVHVAMTTRPDP
jgi:outer membrane protein assembly factor BamB